MKIGEDLSQLLYHESSRRHSDPNGQAKQRNTILKKYHKTEDNMKKEKKKKKRAETRENNTVEPKLHFNEYQ